MILTLFLTVLVAGIGLWFYKRKQIEALNEQLKDKAAIIAALTSHVEAAPQVKPLREGNEKNIKPAPTRPRPKAPAAQEAKPQTQSTGDGKPRRRRRSYKPRENNSKTK